VDMAARLGKACRAARKHAGLYLLDIAIEAGVGQTTVHEFEKGDGWRRQTNEIVAAYARACGTTERALWQAAIDLDERPG